MSRERFDPSRLIRFAWMVVLFAATVQCSKDCARVYRRDIMQVWRIPEGSGLCSISTNNSWFKVYAANDTLYLDAGSDYGRKRTSLHDSYAQVAPFFIWSADENKVSLNFGDITPKFSFEDSQRSYAEPYTTYTNIDDTGLGFSTYILYIKPGDIIFEESQAYPIYKITVIIFELAAVVTPALLP